MHINNYCCKGVHGGLDCDLERKYSSSAGSSINYLSSPKGGHTMNTFFNPVNYLMITFLTLIAYLFAIVAFRTIRNHALNSIGVYEEKRQLYARHPNWEYLGRARFAFTDGLKYRWPFMSLSPRWLLARGDHNKVLDVITWKDFGEEKEYTYSRWYKDSEQYLLVKRPDHAVLGWLLVIDFLLVGLLTVVLWFNAHPDVFSARSAATPVATQVAVSTSAPRPTATPELEVEVTDSGTAIVIDLDKQAPASALLEWINGLKGPDLPALPSALEEWLNSLPWPEVAAFELPEGMDGFVVVARRGDGFELVRLEENGNPVGSPVALKGTKEFTLHARELKWGVRYSNKFRVTDESQGHIDVYVAESGEPSMAVGYHLYNFRWWHWLIWLIVGILGIIAAYQIGKRY